jgi:hypothetical protein
MNSPSPLDTWTGGQPTLSAEEIREFRQIVTAETGIELSSEEAWNRAIELIALFRMLIGPMPEDPENKGQHGVRTLSHLPSSPQTRHNSQ